MWSLTLYFLRVIDILSCGFNQTQKISDGRNPLVPSIGVQWLLAVIPIAFFFSFWLIYFYFYFFSCTESSLLLGLLWCWWAGLLFHYTTQASPCGGFTLYCGAWALECWLSSGTWACYSMAWDLPGPGIELVLALQGRFLGPPGKPSHFF